MAGDAGPVAELVAAVLQAENVTGAVVVAFVDEQSIAELEHPLPRAEEPTDVLSFRGR